MWLEFLDHHLHTFKGDELKGWAVHAAILVDRELVVKFPLQLFPQELRAQLFHLPVVHQNHFLLETRLHIYSISTLWKIYNLIERTMQKYFNVENRLGLGEVTVYALDYFIIVQLFLIL